MKKLVAILLNKWTLRLLGVVALSLLIWFLGPLIAIAGVAPLDNLWVRIALIAILFLIWLTALILARRRSEKADQDMVAGISGGAAPPGDATADEVALLEGRLGEALATLKASRRKRHDLSRRYLYELPWYIVIGPPGSGKTTLLVNSDLEFPLADRFGRDALAGVGGTRNCDWWFTDQAILLDTAGRYTTQDSDANVDAGAWLGFLDLLKRNRPRRPVNGVLVAISLSDLMTLDERAREAHAHAVRKRIDELHEHLGVRMPIYLLLTKCDLIAGFSEFFDNLGRDERGQVWGTTFQLADATSEADILARFGDEYRLLMERIDQRLLWTLHDERDPARRALIYGFPQQLTSLGPMLTRFISNAFKPTRFLQMPLLRGIYFTSGTQEGTPIDRLMGQLAEGFGLDRARLAPATTGKSYFINALFSRVIFPEADLAGSDAKLEARRRWMRRGAYAATALASLALILGWTLSFNNNQSATAAVDQSSVAYGQAAAATALGTTEFEELDKVLAHAQSAADAFPEDAPLSMDIGLFQGKRVGRQADSAYARILETRLLYSVAARLEDMLGDTRDKARLGEALEAYLMLADPERRDPDVVKAVLASDWAATYPDEPELRARLEAHLARMLEREGLRYGARADLVTAARTVLSEVPEHERIYQRIRRIAARESGLDLSLTDLIGRNGERVFNTGEVAADDLAIPGLFTLKGYDQIFAPQSRKLVGQTLQQDWIYGIDESRRGERRSELLTDVKDLYVADYVDSWRRVLNRLSPRLPGKVRDAVGVLDAAAGASSPIRTLVKVTGEETGLNAHVRAQAEAAAAKQPGAAGGLDKATGALDAAAEFDSGAEFRRNQLERLGRAADSMGVSADGLIPTAPSDDPQLKRVDDAFADIHGLLEVGRDGVSELDALLLSLGDVHAAMLAISRSPKRAQESVADALAGDNTPAQELQAKAAELRGPVAQMLASLAGASTDMTKGMASERIAKLWQREIVPFCQKAINGRYPFSRSSPRQTTLEDFSRLFGPGKKLDKFFEKHLADLVDISDSPWRLRDASMGISAEGLKQLERAARIRETFFANGAKPSVGFNVEPLFLDSGSFKFLFDVGGQQVEYRHSAAQGQHFTWPAPSGLDEVRVVFEDLDRKTETIRKQGDWGLFRLLDRAKIRNLGDSTLQATFSARGHRARIEIRADSVYNPFRMPELERFRCPSRL